MKQLLSKAGTFTFLVSAMFLITACSSSNDPDPVKANPTDISLLPQKNSTSTFTLTAGGDWTANCGENWLHLSSTSGNGNATITITAQSDNDSENPRTAVINIVCGESVASVRVTQEPLYKKIRVEADIDNMVILTKSACVKLTGSGDVSYFRAGWLKKTQSAGWTDKKVVDNLTYDSKLEDNEDIMAMSNLTANTDYYLYTVAFDEKGNQGPLSKYEFKTAATQTNRPKISYGSVTIKDGEWHWSTQMNPYTTKYYMYSTDDPDLYALFTSSSVPDAFTAFVVKEFIDGEKLSPIVQNGNWKMTRNSNYFYCMAWAVGSDNKYANEIDQIAGTVKSSARAKDNAKALNLMQIRKLVKQCNISLIK